MDKIGVLILEVRSLGCPSCIALAKIHLLKTRGVIGVHVRGNKVIILFNPLETESSKLLSESGIKNYYRYTIIEERIIDNQMELTEMIKHRYLIHY